MFTAIAKFEKDTIKERILIGLNAARGKLGGRPKKFTDSQLLLTRAAYKKYLVKGEKNCYIQIFEYNFS